MLVVDLAHARDAVGDAQQPHGPARGRPEAREAGVGAEDHRAVRGVEAARLVARPDHLVGHQPHVGDGGVGVHGVGDDLVAPVLQPDVVPHPAVVRVGLVDVSDVLLLPDPVRDAHDVVHHVAVLGLEARHRLLRQVLGRAVEEHVGAAAAIGGEGDGVVARHGLVGQGGEARAGRVPRAACGLVARRDLLGFGHKVSLDA